MEDSEQKSPEQLWKELLDIINRQLEINNQLKDIAESFVDTSAKGKGTVLTEEMAGKVQDLFVELEALVAEERPICHNLLGIED